MPTYDYKCENCEHTFEEWQSIKAEPLKVCPVCKQEKLNRLFGCPFVFVKHAPTTLQEQAEYNSKKFGREECQERELKAKEEYETARKACGMPVKKKSSKTPWWRNGSVPGLKKSDKPLSPAQVMEYKEKMEGMGNTVKLDAKPPAEVMKRAKQRRSS